MRPKASLLMPIVERHREWSRNRGAPELVHLHEWIRWRRPRRSSRRAVRKALSKKLDGKGEDVGSVDNFLSELWLCRGRGSCVLLASRMVCHQILE